MQRRDRIRSSADKLDCRPSPAARARQGAVAAIAALALVSIIGTAPALAQNAYITNYLDGTVSVIDTVTNKVVGSPIPVGSGPFGRAVTSPN
jgi:YVTN family beta-propeller protein